MSYQNNFVYLLIVLTLILMGEVSSMETVNEMQSRCEELINGTLEDFTELDINTCINENNETASILNLENPNNCEVDICLLDCVNGFQLNQEECEVCQCEDVYDGDILTTPSLRQNIEQMVGLQRGHGIKLIKWNQHKESGLYVIPFTLDPEFAEDERQWILNALEDLEDQTCLKFNERVRRERDYLAFVREKGCFSFLGKIFGKQKISIGGGCFRHGTIQHEVMHSIGFWHEQSRPDRDENVKVVWENIRENDLSNFRKRKYSEVDSFESPYDTDSVMHYSSYAFSKNKMPTITDLKGSVIKTQRDRVSIEDVNQINDLYPCSKRRTTRERCVDNFSVCDQLVCKCDQEEIRSMCCHTCKNSGNACCDIRPTTQCEASKEKCLNDIVYQKICPKTCNMC